MFRKSTVYEALYDTIFHTLLLEPSTYINISNQHYVATNGIILSENKYDIQFEAY